ncbi:MAG: beta-lactamase family protein [Anaerolineales bacterium]|nr:beta-lactamase family protein [Anaerolineales bacterium]
MAFNPTLTAPIDYTQPTDPGEVNLSPSGVDAVRRCFEDMLQRDLHPGAQLVLLRHGRPVLDLAQGIAHLGRKQPVTPDSPFLVFSCTKPFTAACIHRLVEEGRITYDTPIGQVWPEFACKGKETATIRHALLHQAGIPVRGLYTQLPLWPFWPLVTRSVARLTAEYPPGERCSYHLVNFGWILGEIVRRITGLSIREYMSKNFILPLNLSDTALGLPPAWNRRAAGIYSGHPEQSNAARVFNIPIFRRAAIPAATLHSTARDLAAFFQMLLNQGQYAGQHYFKPETIQTATAIGFQGMDEAFQVEVRWGMGFMLGGEWNAEPRGAQILGKGSTQRTFGHAGQGTCIAWADFDSGLVMAFTCNRLQDSETARRRWINLADAVWDSLP